jgi:hypothetical protein
MTDLDFQSLVVCLTSLSPSLPLSLSPSLPLSLSPFSHSPSVTLFIHLLENLCLISLGSSSLSQALEARHWCIAREEDFGGAPSRKCL